MRRTTRKVGCRRYISGATVLIDGLPGPSLCARIVIVDGLHTLIAERPRHPIPVAPSGGHLRNDHPDEQTELW